MTLEETGSASSDDNPGTSEEQPYVIEPSIADLIGKGLIERHYGLPYDPAGIHVGDAAVTRDPATTRLRKLPPREVNARWRTFKAYWLGHFASMTGDHLTLVALPLAADRLTGSGFMLGLLVAAETLATVLFGTATGTITDRRHPRPVMIGTDLVRAAVLGILAFLDWQGTYPAALLVIVAFALGLLRLFHDGAESALVARLVPEELDVRSNARLTLSENLGSTLGPLLAGVATSIGLWLAFSIDSITFLLAALAVASVGRASRRRHFDLGPAPEDPAASRPTFRDQFTHAFAAIRSKRVYRRALVVMAAINVAALPLGTQFVTLATRDLGYGGWQIGLMFAVGGLAGVATAPLVERGTVIRPAFILAGSALLSVGVLAVGIAPSTLTAGVAFVAAGIGFTIAFTHFSALRQRVFPPDIQGRVALTSRTILWITIPAGALIGGWMSDAFGAASMWFTCGILGLLACCWGLVRGLGRIRFD